MWMKTAGTAAALAVLVLSTIPGLAGADPTTPAPPPPGAPNTPTPPAPPTPAAPDTPTPPPPAAPKTTIDADGTYAVGTDIVPGVYSSAGPIADGTCSWKRTSNPDGAIIDNALTHKPQVVQIDPTDQAFKTRGCQTWQLSADASPPAPGVAPVLAGLQLQAYLAQLNSRAAASGQLSPP